MLLNLFDNKYHFRTQTDSIWIILFEYTYYKLFHPTDWTSKTVKSELSYETKDKSKAQESKFEYSKNFHVKFVKNSKKKTFHKNLQNIKNILLSTTRVLTIQNKMSDY